RVRRDAAGHAVRAGPAGLAVRARAAAACAGRHRALRLRLLRGQREPPPGRPRLLQGHGRPRVHPPEPGPRGLVPLRRRVLRAGRPLHGVHRPPGRGLGREPPGVQRVAPARLRALDAHGQPAGRGPPRPPGHDAPARRGPAAVTAVDGLLLDVQRRLEAFYALPPRPPVSDFVLSEEEAAGLPGGGSRTLLTQDGDEVSLGVVLGPGVEERLAGRDPRVRLDEDNLDPFCALTEEVSHFLYLCFCAHAPRSVTELELELQGEVDKYL